MLNATEIKTAIAWLYENRRYKLVQWIVDNFGSDSIIHVCVRRMDLNQAAREISEYDLSVQLELVELMY